MSTNEPERPKIVAGIDGSPSSLAALEWAARQADLTGSALVVVAPGRCRAPTPPPALLPVSSVALRPDLLRFRRSTPPGVHQAELSGARSWLPLRRRARGLSE
jgi:nucleotide-binding universal stress UspA family protein